MSSQHDATNTVDGTLHPHNHTASSTTGSFTHRPSTQNSLSPAHSGLCTSATSSSWVMPALLDPGTRLGPGGDPRDFDPHYKDDTLSNAVNMIWAQRLVDLSRAEEKLLSEHPNLKYYVPGEPDGLSGDTAIWPQIQRGESGSGYSTLVRGMEVMASWQETDPGEYLIRVPTCKSAGSAGGKQQFVAFDSGSGMAGAEEEYWLEMMEDSVVDEKGESGSLDDWMVRMPELSEENEEAEKEKVREVLRDFHRLEISRGPSEVRI